MPHTGLLAPNRASALADAWPLWSCRLPPPVGLSACERRASVDKRWRRPTQGQQIPVRCPVGQTTWSSRPWMPPSRRHPGLGDTTYSHPKRQRASGQGQVAPKASRASETRTSALRGTMMTPVPANETAENWEPRANGACLACGRQLTRGTSAVPACQQSPLPPPPPRHLNSLAAASSFVSAERGGVPRSLRWAAYSSGRQYFYFLRVKQMAHRLRPELGKSRISILPRRGDGRRKRGLVRQAASHLLCDVRNIGWHTARCEGNRKTTRRQPVKHARDRSVFHIARTGNTGLFFRICQLSRYLTESNETELVSALRLDISPPPESPSCFN